MTQAWLISDTNGNELARVLTSGQDTAANERVKATGLAGLLPEVYEASARDGGIFVRRLRSDQLLEEVTT